MKVTDQLRRVHGAAFRAGLLTDDLQFRDWTGHRLRNEMAMVLLAARSLDNATLELGANPPRPELPIGDAATGIAAGAAAAVAGLFLVPDPGDPLVLATVLTAASIVMVLVQLAVLRLRGRSARRRQPDEDLDDTYAELRREVSALVAAEEAGANREELLWWLASAAEFLEMADADGRLSSSRPSPDERSET